MINMELEYRRYLNKYFNLRNIYESAESFSDGLAIVKSSQGYGAIDKEFNEVIPCLYHHLSSFSDGLAYFEKKEDGKVVRGFINKDNEVVFKLDNDYEYESGFSNGVAILKRRGQYREGYLYYYVSKTGQIFPNYKGFREAKPFSEGYGAAAMDADGLGYDTKLNWAFYSSDFEIIDEDYSYLSDFRGGLAHAKRYQTEGFIDTTGSFVIKYNGDIKGGKTYYDADSEYIYVSVPSKQDYFRLYYYRINKKDGIIKKISLEEFEVGIKKHEYLTCGNDQDVCRILDSSNRIIFESKDIWISKFSEGLCFYRGDSKHNRSYFVYGRDKLLIEDIGYIDEAGQKKPLNNITIPVELRYEKKLFKYQLKDGLSVKYMPLYDLGSFILCVDKSGCYLFNKSDEKYLKLSDTAPEKVFFSGNMLCIDNKNFIIVGEKIIDIGPISITNIDVKLGVSCSNVLSYEEFKNEVEKNPHFIEGLLEKKQVAEVKEDIASSLKRTEQESNKLYLVNQAIQKTMAQLNTLLNLKQSLINSTDSTTFERYSIDRNMLLLEKEGHWVINPDLYGLLKFFDLSVIDFTNVAVNGVDFSYSNAKIDPQTIYNKDMSGGNFSGMQFIGVDFHDVNICGANFTDCVIDFTDIKDGSIYDDCTIFSSKRGL